MGFIPEEIVRQVLDRADIVEVVSSYVPLKPAGRNFKALSPFKHEKTPSFIVSPDKQIFHCFSSGMGGNAISFVMQMERLSFPEAVRFLAQKYAITIPETGPQYRQSDGKADLVKHIRQVNTWAANAYHRNLLTNRSDAAKVARDYLKGRGVDLEAVKTFQLGFALDEWDALLQGLRSQNVSLALMEKAGLILARKSGDGYYDRFRNRIIFPIFDEQGRSIGFGARTMDPANSAKYVNSPETPVYVKGRHLYGFHLSKYAVGQMDQMIIVEGYMDFIMPFLSGVQNIAASLGTALTPDQIRLIRRYTKNIVMLFDNDPAGEAAMNRSLDLLIDEGMSVRVAMLAEHEDPDSFVRARGVEAFRERVGQAKSVVDFKIGYLVDRYGKQTMEGRARIAAEMLPTINRFANNIAKVDALKTLAREFSLVQGALMTQEALLKELNDLARQAGTRRETVAASSAPSRRDLTVSPAERTLLQLMLVDRQCVKYVQERNVLDIFSDDVVKDVIEKICAFHDRDQDAPVSVLISTCDARTGNYLSSLLAEEGSIVGDRMKMCHDCIQRLHTERAREQRRMIIAQMERAKENGDQQRLAELTEEFNRHIKGMV